LAIGSDFDGMEDTDLIKDLEDVSKYQNLVNAFQELGLNNEEIEKVLFTNAGEFFQITN
jgi:microsomal dipeptidase-like Zn-dependent dipeptidase